ncbi:hypothetical protein KJ359_004711 [Pestalotiopsis sp. 9143b]|nr:hypothetical protein KJ359_004711 [Pestalotiopsis sp. 9143b]
MSPRSLPSPMHPASYSSYTTNKQHERAILNSFDGATTTTATVKSGGSSRAHPSPTTATRLIPIDEEAETPLTARLERFTILPSLTLHYSGLPSPPGAPQVHLYSPQPSREYLQRSRTVLEPGTMSSPRRPVESSNSALSRRNSVVMGTRPLPPPPPPRKQSVEEIRDQLRSWGHVYYGNVETADAFVIARSLRRQSNPPMHNTGGAGLPKIVDLSQLTVRAIIKPKDVERPSFLIQRTFNLDALRATIPNPMLRYQPLSQLPPLPLRVPIAPASSSSAARAALPTRPPLPRRRSSIRSGELLSSRGRHGRDHDTLIRDVKAVPIHLKYARAHLPVLAALLASGHVREGDVVYLPLPHPEAWPHTVRYVYTGQGELTAAMRENILYLAGKV